MHEQSTTAKRTYAPRQPNVSCTCKTCGKAFTVWASHARMGMGIYCSRACSGIGSVTRVEVECGQCGIRFDAFQCHLRKGAGKFCSRRCLADFQAGDLAERFSSLTNDRPVNGCWIWQGNTRRDTGYGYLTVRNRKEHAHRVAWVLATGHMPVDGESVLHTCDNRPCVRDDETGTYVLDGVEYERRGHLFLADHRANMRDMAIKQRAARGSRNGSIAQPERLTRGEANPHSTLTNDAIRDIRARYSAGGISQQALADEYGVLQTTISRIVLRRAWAHIE